MKIINILKVLNKHQVKYAIAGGVAVGLYGFPRATLDVDILIDFSEKNVKRLAKAFTEINFKPKVPINVLDLAKEEKRKEWIEEKNAKVISFLNPQEHFLQIDVFILKCLSKFKIKNKKIDNITIKVISLDELIKMKKEAARPLDLIDLDKLLEIKKQK